MKKRLSREERIGVRYGRLVVLTFDSVIKQRAYFRCMCDCGKETLVSDTHLTTGHTTSCGCFHRERLSEVFTETRKKMGRVMPEFEIGKKYNRLTVVSHEGRNDYTYELAKYKCDCGNFLTTLRTVVEISESTKSCGCLSRETSSRTCTEYLKSYRRNAGRNEDVPMTEEDRLERGRFQKELAGLIRKRDANTCVLCKTKSRDTEVHHILPWSKSRELRFEPKNLVVLCSTCHFEKAHKKSRRGNVCPEIARQLTSYVEKLYSTISGPAESAMPE